MYYDPLVELSLLMYRPLILQPIQITAYSLHVCFLKTDKSPKVWTEYITIYKLPHLSSSRGIQEDVNVYFQLHFYIYV